jgi:putative membrane protein
MLLKKRIPIIFFFKKIFKQLVIILILSLSIGFIHKLDFAKNLDVPFSITSLLGIAISILLAFRTNQAYDRWWEARKIWGAVVNDSRSLVREIISFTELKTQDLHEANEKLKSQPLIRDNVLDYVDGHDTLEDFFKWQHKLSQPESDTKEELEDFEVTEEMVKELKAHAINNLTFKQITFCYLLGEHLRKLDSTETLAKYFSESEQKYFKAMDNKPNMVLLKLAQNIRVLKKTGTINFYQQIQLEHTISQLTTHLGKCERIKNTPFPQTYSILLHFLIYVFVAILPISLLNYTILEETLLSLTVSLMFFVIEKTSIAKEDPFENRPTDVSITALAQTIERSLLEMIGRKDLIPEVNEPSYFVL